MKKAAHRVGDDFNTVKSDVQMYALVATRLVSDPLTMMASSLHHPLTVDSRPLTTTVLDTTPLHSTPPDSAPIDTLAAESLLEAAATPHPLRYNFPERTL